MTTPAIVPRRARLEETDMIADLYLRARRAAVPAIPPLVHPDADVRRWVAGQVERSIGAGATEVWVAATSVDPRAVLGFMITRGEWLEQLYVDPELTGRGIGARLLDHAKAGSQGGLQLWTFQANRRAQRFYVRHGFVEVERTDGSTNEEQAPDIRYRWEGAPGVPDPLSGQR